VTTQQKAYAAWIFICLIWGTTYLAIRLALDGVPPFLMAGFRWVVGGVVLLAILKARGETIPARTSWPALATLGVLFIGFGNGGVVWAEQTVPSGLTAVLVAMSPFWLVGLDALAGSDEVLTARRIAGLIIGFSGVVVLVWPDLRAGGAGPGFLGGLLATQVASLGWATGSTYSRRRSRDENVLAAASLEMIFAGVVMLAIGAAAGEWPRLRYTLPSSAALTYLTVVGSILAFPAFTYALKHLPVATVSLYAYVNPVIAMILGTVFLAEPFSARILTAAAIVLVGMGMVRSH
jgi:drug/metabolite transporter (DMT)-like permease